MHVARERPRNGHVVDVQRADAVVRPVVGLQRPEREEARGAEMLPQERDRCQVELYVSRCGRLRESEQHERVAGDEESRQPDACARVQQERGATHCKHDCCAPGSRARQVGVTAKAVSQLVSKRSSAERCQGHDGEHAQRERRKALA